VRALVVRVGADRVRLPVAAVQEVVDAPQPTPLPGAPAGLRGVVALRGRVVPLWDGAALLGLVGGGGALCAHLRVDGVHLGLLVDAVEGLVDGDPASADVVVDPSALLARAGGAAT
jgi:purine-binding chemotaxis protein CheW